MDKKRLLSCAFLFTFTISISSIYADGGASAGNILTQSLSAKAQGMGEAFSSIPADRGDVTAIQYNPASLGFLKDREISATYKNGIIGENLGMLAFGSPILPEQSRNWGSYSGTFLYNSVGTTKFTTPTGALKELHIEKDYGFIFSYSNTLFGNLSLGGSGKILHSEILEKFKATAYALDLGGLYKWGPSNLGVSVQNIGNGLKYDKRTEELPFTFRAGASYHMKWFNLHRTMVAADLYKERKENFRANFGMEYVYDDLRVPLAFRFGYRAGQDIGKINYGLGIQFGPYKIDYSMQVMGDSGNSHFVTLGVTLGTTPYTPQTRSFEEGPTTLSDTSSQTEIPQKSVQPANPVLKKRFH